MTIVEFQVVRCHCRCHEPRPIGLPTRHQCARCGGAGKLLWRPTSGPQEVEVMRLPPGWQS